MWLCEWLCSCLFVCRHRLVGDDSVFCHACNKASCTTRPIWDASILVSSGLPVWLLFMLVQDMGKLNFPEEEYNVADIKASASTFDDLVATSRRKARRVVSRKWWALQSWLHVPVISAALLRWLSFVAPSSSMGKAAAKALTACTICSLWSCYIWPYPCDLASHNATSLSWDTGRFITSHPYACHELGCWIVTCQANARCTCVHMYIPTYDLKAQCK